MIGHMRARVGTTLALLAGVALTGCSGAGGSAAPGTPEPSTPSSIEAAPRQPHVTGDRQVELRAGLAVMTDDRCTPDGRRRVCSADGTRSWAPLGDPSPAILVAAGTHLADRHTSWTTVLRFAPGSRTSLHGAAHEAATTGGVVLVLAGGRVLAAVPASGVRGTKATVTGLDKPTAWGLVAAFEGP